MLTILTQEPLPRQAEATGEPPTIPEAAAAPAPEATDYELVLGRGHIASVLFLAMVVLVVFSAISYLAGKSSAPKKTAGTPEGTMAVVEQPSALERPPMIDATVVPASSAAPPAVTAPRLELGDEPPLFADPKQGAIYLQIGAVERGIAVIMVEGLRKRGFESFAAPGPSEKTFRVLIGPLPDPQAFVRAKQSVDELGLATFARKFQQ